PIAIRPVEAERRTPIVNYQRDPALESESLKPSVDITRMIYKPVAPVGCLARLTHPDEVGREAAAESAQVRNHVAPEIRRSRVAVQKNDRIAAPAVDVCYRGSGDCDVAPRMRIVC